MRARAIALALLAGTTLATQVASAQLISPAFSYQGKLEEAGAPANGSYQFYFELYAASTGGSALANYGTAAAPAVLNVQNGLFNTDLIFPAIQFGDADRFLQVYVRAVGAPTYTPLPRQRLSPTPFANFSSNTRGMQVDLAGRVFFGPYGTAYRMIVGDAAQGELLELRSASNNFTLMTLNNTSAGGRAWALLSTGPGWGTGAGDLVFRDIGAAADRFILGADGNAGVGNLTLNPASYGRTFTISGNGSAQGGSSAAVFHNTTLNQQWTTGIIAPAPSRLKSLAAGATSSPCRCLKSAAGATSPSPTPWPPLLM